jgi:hypothetical protein
MIWINKFRRSSSQPRIAQPISLMDMRAKLKVLAMLIGLVWFIFVAPNPEELRKR